VVPSKVLCVSFLIWGMHYNKKMSIESLDFENEEPEETIDLRQEEIKGWEGRVENCAERIRMIKEKNDVNGGSSFFDVTGNLLGALKSNLRILKNQPLKDCYQAVVKTTPFLEQYLDLVEINQAIREAEIRNRDGALPEVRREADAIGAQDKTGTFRPIIYYVNQLKNRTTPVDS